MRKLSSIAFCVLTAAVATPALAALGVDVRGQGMLDPQRTFAVSARVNADGTATGQATLVNRAFTGDSQTNPYQAHFDISCGKMLDQRTMVLGGFANRTNDSNLKDAAYFIVRDNGEPGGGRDQISRTYFFDNDPNTTGDPMLCLLVNDGDFPLETIRNGNIQVRLTQ